ncbi:MAG TPA: SdiA-regulated domain-containing protein [Candidatus Polarisedimenticolia bacterium]|jgi:hypothetical protein
MMLIAGILLALALPAARDPGGLIPDGRAAPAGHSSQSVPQTRPTTLTSLWRDTPADPSRVRIDPIPGVTEPSDLLLRGGSLYTISDSYRRIYQLGLAGPGGGVRLEASWEPRGLPEETDLEALAELPGGEVLLASETNGTIFVVHPFPTHVCAAWQTGIQGTCLIGRANCGIEAMAILPGPRLFVAKERDPRAAYLFDLPERPCAGATVKGRTSLRLPEEVGPDISAATWDAASGHLLLVARTNQRVLEFEVVEPAARVVDAPPPSLVLVGSFSFAATEDRLDYVGLRFPRVEGIAVDAGRVLYLAIDNNEELSRRFGDRRAALLRFFPGG